MFWTLDAKLLLLLVVLCVYYISLRGFPPLFASPSTSAGDEHVVELTCKQQWREQFDRELRGFEAMDDDYVEGVQPSLVWRASSRPLSVGTPWHGYADWYRDEVLNGSERALPLKPVGVDDAAALSAALAKQAWVLLLDGDDKHEHYLSSALAHCAALRALNHYERDIVVLVNADEVSESARRRLRAMEGVAVREFEALRHNASNVRMVKHLNKIRVYSLTDYEKVVFVDLDMVLLDSLDYLFDFPGDTLNLNMEDLFHFNSGIMVVEPSTERYEALLRHARTYVSGWDATDQALLDSYLASYSLLPWSACAKKRMAYTHPHMFRLGDSSLSSSSAVTASASSVRCVHWTGEKPWTFQKRASLERLTPYWYAYLARWVRDYRVPKSDYESKRWQSFVEQKRREFASE